MNVLHESDDAHGWLIVSQADVQSLGLSAEDFTHFSYATVIDGVYVFALEEDCDAYKLHTASKSAGVDWDITERTCSRSDVRNWDCIELLQSHAKELAAM
tara:strand:+ start:886 stop:1185 length:300 start_codon:yes stop_codon:yes gene_type:complete